MSEYHEPVYMVGDKVKIEDGRTAEILLVKWTHRGPHYLATISPGSLQGYEFITITFPDGEIRNVTANWFYEAELHPLE